MNCINPIRVVNPKYRSRIWESQHRGENPDDFYLLVPCGKCLLCRKRYSKDWQVRLMLEYGFHKEAHFVTLTINPENYSKVSDHPEIYFRKFLEHIRYRQGNSPRHFFISELGAEHDRLHFHGIFFGAINYDFVSESWPYGFINIQRCTKRVIPYVLKYLFKSDPNYKPLIFASNRPFGLGYTYLEQKAQYHERSMIMTVSLNGFKYALPRYFKSKIWPKGYLADYYALNPIPYSYKGFTFQNLREYSDFMHNIKDALTINKPLKHFDIWAFSLK